VHDEIVIEVPEVRAPRWGIVKETMETIFPLAVPLKVDAHYGRSWYDAKGNAVVSQIWLATLIVVFAACNRQPLPSAATAAP